MSTSALDQAPPIRCFLSYAHEDEVALKCVGSLKRSLEYFAHASRSRRVEIFLDHESIGWGHDWRDSIRAGIEGALVFMPLITQAYFKRPMCREELLLFYDTASKLGVTELLLPVVILGENMITEESADAVVRIVAARQFRVLREAVFAGAMSPRWNHDLYKLADELVDAVEAAEGRLELLEQVSMSSHAPISQGGYKLASERDESTASDLTGKVVEIVNEMSQVEGLADRFTAILEQFLAQGVRYVLRLASESRARTRSLVGEMTEATRGLIVDAAQVASRLESETVVADSKVREVWSLLEAKQADVSVRFNVQEAVGGVVLALRKLEKMERRASALLEDLRPHEVTNVPLRRSLRPLRAAARKTKSTAAIVTAWEVLAEGD